MIKPGELLRGVRAIEARFGALRRFAVIRPYPEATRQVVFRHLEGAHWRTLDHLWVGRGTPNLECLAWIREHEHEFGLLLLPFHPHADRDDNRVDGITVARGLPRTWAKPILMPVTPFSIKASFPRLLAELLGQRPDLKPLLRAVTPQQLSEPSSRAWLAEPPGVT